MMQKRLLKKYILLYGSDLKKWPLDLSISDIGLIQQAIQEDAKLQALALREATFDHVLQGLHVPDPIVTLEKNIYQTAMADIWKLPKPYPHQKFIYSRSTIRLFQRKLGSLVTMSVCLITVFACGWGVGQYYQQPIFEITDFYTYPAVSMIFEE